MSRFLSQKSTELNPQLIAKITAKLDIPLHEMIDFVDEEFSERFVRLVKFYKDELNEGLEPNIEELEAEAKKKTPEKEVTKESSKEKTTEEKTEKKNEETTKENKAPLSKGEQSIREKLESLTPRQRAFMTEFLNLNLEERDLVVDLGNNLFQYFKMKGMNF
jgi:signal recognition particle GTPase